MISVDEQVKIISKGAAEIIEADELKDKIEKCNKEKRPMIIKLGLDPTAPDIHLGHTVVLRKVRQLQDLGNKAVIIIGDFTGMIGDPTGRAKSRKPLTREQVLENAATYTAQLFKILDRDKTEIRFNSEWLSKLTFEDVINLASKYTVTRMMEREDFKNRFQSQQPIYIHEFLYPLMQGYDSINIKADIELGGTDQKFNVLMGRTLQKEYGLEKQIAILMPILEGLDGVNKMSKSLGNYIGIDEDKNDMYSKAMTIPDNLIVKYYELVTDVHPDEIKKISDELESGEVNPRDIKMNLAREIVKLYHGEKAAMEAEEFFKTVFQKGEIPDDIDKVEVTDEELNESNDAVICVIRKAGFSPSNSEARRLIKQGGVKINGEAVSDSSAVKLHSEDILQVGKKRMAKIIIK
ncbi:MAG TPA: tyrosine--tRNA ligase [Clostridiaceae bacterium]|jgi:tyrosyl-tRNA synthetase|nr:tyrosine--tRNA ligase [Clostridiaceae bacterium]HBG38331.1 tyrosine--tRNA ligase [Clostridiaceae bacterium]HBN27847.1 tyrosine--tRNA ligase [Clostridiaceae bacterium]HBX49390.1 tyrosine--tRNA ligase [Clostridiaceae bacterium]HCL50007.1 tyrosine--tRNA ligase [Clostridiaceae bacterium]